jgi:hypothetical protein
MRQNVGQLSRRIHSDAIAGSATGLGWGRDEPGAAVPQNARPLRAFALTSAWFFVAAFASTLWPSVETRVQPQITS